MTLAQLSSWTSPNSVSIFVQPPGQAFVQFLLSRVPIPNPLSVRLDLAETETVERRFTITRNPVERLVAQNRIREPDVLVLTGMLSANPLLSPVQSFGLARIDKIMLAQLRKMTNSIPLLPMFVVTPERKYPNMLLTSLREQYDDSTGHGVMLTLTFEEIQFAFAGLVQPDVDAIQLGAASASSMGPTAPDEIVDPGGVG